MKYPNLIKVIFPTFLITACGEQNKVYSKIDLSDTGFHEEELVDLSLGLGKLNGNLYFDEVEMPLITTESNNLVPVQVAGFIEDIGDYESGFLRIKFSSSFTEWVGYSSQIYSTESECLEFESHCDAVEVGKGESGYFETEDGWMSIQNAYCRYSEYPYSYTITAVVYDISSWPVAEISEPSDIDIYCHPN